MKLLQVIKKLISIPSYVNNECNEEKVGDFIYNYLKSNTSLIVKKQKVEEKRNNIIAYSPSCVINNRLNVETMFVDHIDTVEPKKGWKFDQYESKEIDGNLYGLGSYDTKGNVAVLMKLAEQIKKQKVMLLFYCDEEYDFKGMKHFIKKYKDKLTVKRIISTDGNDIQIRYACRGLIEMEVELYGKSGHSANPENGNNAITSLNNILNNLDKKLKTKYQEGLGCPTLNISYIKGGMLKNKDNNGVILGKNGNNIADYVEATIEIRTNERTPLTWVKKNLFMLAKQYKIKLVVKNIRHNLTPWLTNKNEVLYLSELIEKNGQSISYTDASVSGYVDIAMLATAFNAKCCTIGAKGANSHAVGEFVEINSLEVLYKILSQCV